jgi:ribosomal protein L11 methylase PrmA
MESYVRAALSAAGPGATVVDLACNEGWFSHRMLEWGASRALGVDIRPPAYSPSIVDTRSSRSPAERLELRCADVLDLTVAELGTLMWFCV